MAHTMKSLTYIWHQRFCPVIRYLHMMNRSLNERQAIDKKISKPATIQDEVTKRCVMETNNKIMI